MKNYTDDALACAIYQLANGRMQAAGQKMPCSEAVFSVMTNARPDYVSYQDIAHLGNADFMEAAYLLLLRRPLDEPTAKSCQENMHLPAREFQAMVLKNILDSDEYRKRNIPLTECPFVFTEPKPMPVLLTWEQPVIPQRLIRMYQKMPRFLQKLAKKIAGKE